MAVVVPLTRLNQAQPSYEQGVAHSEFRSPSVLAVGPAAAAPVGTASPFKAPLCA